MTPNWWWHPKSDNNKCRSYWFHFQPDMSFPISIAILFFYLVPDRSQSQSDLRLNVVRRWNHNLLHQSCLESVEKGRTEICDVKYGGKYPITKSTTTSYTGILKFTASCCNTKRKCSRILFRWATGGSEREGDRDSHMCIEWAGNELIDRHIPGLWSPKSTTRRKVEVSPLLQCEWNGMIAQKIPSLAA